MKATQDWLNATNRKYLASANKSAVVHLGKYTAELYEAGAGDPIVLIPGSRVAIGAIVSPLFGDRRVVSYAA